MKKEVIKLSNDLDELIKKIHANSENEMSNRYLLLCLSQANNMLKDSIKWMKRNELLPTRR